MSKKIISFIMTFFLIIELYPLVKLEKNRVNEIRSYLSDGKAVSFGQPMKEREVWEHLAKVKGFNKIISDAEKEINLPAETLSDELFLIFSKTGSRTEWENANNKRLRRLRNFFFAECIENKGRFIKAIGDIIKVYCTQSTWVRPAHDKTLENFYKQAADIDLESSAIGWDFAVIYFTLGERLSPEIKKLIKDNITKRILNPFSEMISGKKKENWWLYTTNNWNAVCLAGVIASGLIISDTVEEKALFIAAAEVLIKNFLAGFNKDGYCTEGVSYWNYGFGHFIMLSELINKATDGKLDLLKIKEARLPAEYAASIEIVPGIIPAFADCTVTDNPEVFFLKYLSRKLGIKIRAYSEDELNYSGGKIFEILFNNLYASNDLLGKEIKWEGAPLRSWFADTGLLISRPKRSDKTALSFAVKAGNNDEHHNHNDVSSFVVLSGESVVLTDPGAEVYTARTFSQKRYESNALNSYGHSVPRPGDILQRTGKEAYGKILLSDFSDEEDRVVMDIKSAYELLSMKKLEREFIYSRKDNCSLTVIDRVEFAFPESYESALMTFGGFQVLGKDNILVYDGKGMLSVHIDTNGALYEIKSERINENLRAKRTPLRISIRLKNKVKSAILKFFIEPVLPDKGKLLLNGSFEYGTLGWEMKEGSMGEVSSEKAAAGRYSLKITDESEVKGSNVYSVEIDADGKSIYEFKGNFFTEKGEGLGIYVNFYDKDGNLLNKPDAKGNIDPIAKIGSSNNQWDNFTYKFETPQETKKIKLWLHSFNSAKVKIFLDDLEILKK